MAAEYLVGVETARTDLGNGMCPICGAGPFLLVAGHTNRAHGVDKIELRYMAGLGVGDSILIEEAWDTRSEASKLKLKRDPDIMRNTQIASRAGGYKVKNRSPKWLKSQRAHAARMQPLGMAANRDRPKQICNQTGCVRRTHGRGLCSMHYKRMRRTGRPAHARSDNRYET